MDHQVLLKVANRLLHSLLPKAHKMCISFSYFPYLYGTLWMLMASLLDMYNSAAALRTLSQQQKRGASSPKTDLIQAIMEQVEEISEYIRVRAQLA